MAWSFRKALGIAPSGKATAFEILPGVTKPTYALAGMVAAYVLKNPENIKKGPFESGAFQIWSDDKMSVKLYEKEMFDGSFYHLISEVSFRGKPFQFDNKEKELIKEAMVKAIALNEERANEDAKAALQQQACDVIEALFGAPIEKAEQTENALDKDALAPRAKKIKRGVKDAV